MTHLVLILALALTHQAPAALTMAVKARAFQPGELVLVTLSFPEAPTGVTLIAFGSPVPVFPSADGTWQALVGLDLDLEPGDYEWVAEADLRVGSRPAESDRHRHPEAIRDAQTPGRARLRQPAARDAVADRSRGGLLERRLSVAGRCPPVEHAVRAAGIGPGQQRLRTPQRLQRRSAQPPCRRRLSEPGGPACPGAERRPGRRGPRPLLHRQDGHRRSRPGCVLDVRAPLPA